MTLDDDSLWLDALAGRVDRNDAVQSRSLVQEALALRGLIRSQESEFGPTVLEIDAERVATLIERARREGLLATRETRFGSTRRAWSGVRRLSLAAAALVIIAVGAGIWQSQLPPTETLRGVERGTVLLTARDPQALKHQLVGELQAAGVRVSSYERLGRAGIDADLPQPLSSELKRVLERHHIPVPADGALVVEIEGPDRP
jgi:hypothetical protein